MVLPAIGRQFSRVFGSRNERVIKSYRKRVERINALEPEMRKLTDAELRAKTLEFNERHIDKEEDIDVLMPEVMAVAREAMDRAVGIRNAFNPEHREKFDADKLPADMQALYRQKLQELETLEPEPVLGGDPAPAHLRLELPVAFYDAVRAIYDVSRPPFRARPFDVQLIGGMVLSEGRIAEMRTGEGKTIVAPLACYPACVEGMQCHVVTVNDYLVQRDRDWVFPFYYALGLNVGAIHPQHQQPPQLKQQAYMCNVVYGTNSEFGFDYLRDNMKTNVQEQMQRRRDFCIVDEIDSILIDEARTPLIISGPAHDSAPRYELADEIAAKLVKDQTDWNAANAKLEAAELRVKGLEGDIRNARDKSKAAAMKAELKQLGEDIPSLEAARDRHTQYYEVEMEKKSATLTHDGIAQAQKYANIGSFYVGDNIDFPHLLGNAIRAHTVYKKDQHYVVQNNEVVIVDEFTGRLMVGRQWSDGLHQAVECKEKVEIKKETQTLATVTIQNFFKLYDRLAGMTGTAITEATEFNDIYGLDVVSIPTNRPIARTDRNDLVFLSLKDKWNAIVDEVKRVHDIGRPVLVGTTSVDRSEMLSKLLTQRHGIRHAVLNAKAEHAEREGNIVEDAGQLGAVMIATNMAGRGTDIKLGRIEREALIAHWKQRDLVPAKAEASMSDDELVAMSYRHQAARAFNLGGKSGTYSDDELKLRLLRKWVVDDAFVSEDKAAKMSLDECMATLDDVPDYQRHRLQVFTSIEAMGGLHIVGTERHESRRIDNQLRGRAGRQGDNGSSRFFISLEDDLMQMFAGERTKMILSKLGMKEGDAIEHGMVSRSVERAQRKVEERNYEIRKSLLEYDEVMEHQRSAFYGLRQNILEGKDVEETIFGYIDDAIDDACAKYLAPDYVKVLAAEWCLQTHDISVDPARLHLEDLREAEEVVRKSAKEEAEQTIGVTIGEYMSNDTLPEDWDLLGLVQWAKQRFDVQLSTHDLKGRDANDVALELQKAAGAKIDELDLSGIARFMEPGIPQRDLANWCNQKFEFEVTEDELQDRSAEEAADHIIDRAHAAYHEREIEYPVRFVMDMIMQTAQAEQQLAASGQPTGNQAIGQLLQFVYSRYQERWDPEETAKLSPKEIYEKLLDLNGRWMGRGGEPGLMAEQAGVVAKEYAGDTDALVGWINERFGIQLDPAVFEETEAKAAYLEAGDDEWTAKARTLIEKIGRGAFRGEFSRLEQHVLMQIIDAAWKDHLHTMDQLKSSIGLRGYAERDPRIEFKREGAEAFAGMRALVRDRVTEMIFRARLAPQVQRQVSPEQMAALRQAMAERQAAAAAQGGADALPEPPADPSGVQAEAVAAATAATAAEPATEPAADDVAVEDAPTRKQRRNAPKHGGPPEPKYKQKRRKR